MANRETEPQLPRCNSVTIIEQEPIQCTLDSGHERWYSKNHIGKASGAIVRWVDTNKVVIQHCYDYHCHRCGMGYALDDRRGKTPPNRYGETFCSQDCYTNNRKESLAESKASR